MKQFLNKKRKDLVRKLLPLLLIVMLVVSFIYLTRSKETTPLTNSLGNSYSYVVEETSQGFTPPEVTVIVGDTIKFKTARNRPFWPASNPHPTHTIYPQFDSKKPIDPKDSWSFTFDKVGIWRYHDHLVPGFQATVIIRPANATQADIIKAPKCQNIDVHKITGPIDPDCWTDLINFQLEKNGVNAAFETLRTLYTADPKFSQNGCHLHAHYIGDAAYALFLKNHRDLTKLEFSPLSDSCGYGYYHGFLEHLIRDNPDPNAARAFCDYMTAKAKSNVPGIHYNCYHGLGHGFVTEPTTDNGLKTPEDIIRKPLTICDHISKTNDPEENHQCREGVFNTLADWMEDKIYGLSLDENNPLTFCKQFTNPNYRLPCYSEFSLKINYGSDIAKVAKKYADDIADDNIAALVIDNAITSIIERSTHLNNYDTQIKQCQNLQPRLQEDCIKGIIGGLMAHGIPGYEYIKAIQTCQSPALDPKYVELCNRHLISKLNMFYTKDKVHEVCNSLNTKYKNLCLTS